MAVRGHTQEQLGKPVVRKVARQLGTRHRQLPRMEVPVTLPATRRLQLRSEVEFKGRQRKADEFMQQRMQDTHTLPRIILTVRMLLTERLPAVSTPPTARQPTQRTTYTTEVRRKVY